VTRDRVLIAGTTVNARRSIVFVQHTPHEIGGTQVVNGVAHGP
jgi:hypothetical protein